MNDLSLIFNPHELKVVDTNSEGLKIERIQFKNFVPETSEELYTKAVKELVYRTASDEVKELYFSENAMPGALDIIVSTVKNSLSIIATILHDDKANNFYQMKVDHDSEEDKELSDDEKYLKGTCVDFIYTYVEPSEIFKKDAVTIVVNYSKLSKDGKCVMNPITVRSEVTLNVIRDNLRDKVLYEKNDTVYIVSVGGIATDEEDDYVEKYNKQFTEAVEHSLVHFVNAVERAEDNKNCACCERAKDLSDKCFAEWDVDSVEDATWWESILENKIDLKGENGNYEFKITNKIIDCLTPRVKHITRLMAEYTLALRDYMGTWELVEDPTEEEKEYDPDHGSENYVPADPDNEVDVASS